jgi:ligand-binding sensor domain-containing protein
MHQHKTAIYLIILVIVTCYFETGCKKDSNSPPSIFAVYNTSNSGLPFNDVRIIISDWDNNIWMSACCGALVKFDGISWTTYSASNSPLPTYEINSLACDKNNKIWIGTSNGLVSLWNGQWNTIDIPAASFPNKISFLATDSNNAVWAAFDGDSGVLLGKYENSQWSVYDTLFSDYDYFNISGLCIDKYNKVWIAVEYYYNVIAVFRFDGIQLDTVYEDGFNGSPSISDLKADLEGNIWMIGNYNYYVEYPLFKVFDSNSLLENNSIPYSGGYAMASTPAYPWVVGQITSPDIYYGWATAAYFDHTITTWVAFDSTNSNLPGAPSSLNCICSDHENNIWMGGTNGLYSTMK